MKANRDLIYLGKQVCKKGEEFNPKLVPPKQLRKWKKKGFFQAAAKKSDKKNVEVK
jgi:hypothetical protein